MGAVLFILIITLVSCSHQAKDRPRFKNDVWVNQDLKFDTIYSDVDKSMYSVYGSATLIYLDANHTIKFVTNTFIKLNDSISWGEPGINLTAGSWKESATGFIAVNRLVEKTFLLPTDTSGHITIDSFELSGDTLIQNNKNRFVPAGLLTNELRTFLTTSWSDIESKNSR